MSKANAKMVSKLLSLRTPQAGSAYSELEIDGALYKKDDSSKNLVHLTPSALTKSLWLVFLVIGSFLTALSLVNTIFLNWSWIFLLLPGLIFLFLFLEFRNPESALVNAVQEAAKTKGATGKLNKILWCFYHAEMDSELDWCNIAFLNLSDRAGSYKPSHEKREASRKQVLEMTEILSFGTVKLEWGHFFPEYTVFENPDTLKKWREDVQKDKQVVEDINLIWSKMVFPMRFSSTTWGSHRRKDVVAVGKRLGIDVMIDSYLSGVPIEAIVCGLDQEH